MEKLNMQTTDVVDEKKRFLAPLRLM
jgi:hypothetical protein